VRVERKNLRDILVDQLAQLVVEVGLLLLELIEALLTLFELVAHLDFNSARLVDFSRLLIEFLLDDM